MDKKKYGFLHGLNCFNQGELSHYLLNQLTMKKYAIEMTSERSYVYRNHCPHMTSDPGRGRTFSGHAFLYTHAIPPGLNANFLNLILRPTPILKSTSKLFLLYKTVMQLFNRLGKKNYTNTLPAFYKTRVKKCWLLMALLTTSIS